MFFYLEENNIKRCDEVTAENLKYLKREISLLSQKEKNKILKMLIVDVLDVAISSDDGEHVYIEAKIKNQEVFNTIFGIDGDVSK